MKFESLNRSCFPRNSSTILSRFTLSSKPEVFGFPVAYKFDVNVNVSVSVKLACRFIIVRSDIVQYITDVTPISTGRCFRSLETEVSNWNKALKNVDMMRFSALHFSAAAAATSTNILRFVTRIKSFRVGKEW